MAEINVDGCTGEASGEDILGSKARYFPDASLQDATRSPLHTPHVKLVNRENPPCRPNGTGIIILQDGNGNVNGGDGRLADGMGDGGDDGDADGRGEAAGNNIRGSKARYFPDASLQDATRSPVRTPRVKWENRVNLAGRPNGTGIIILQDSDGNVNGGDGR